MIPVRYSNVKSEQNFKRDIAIAHYGHYTVTSERGCLCSHLYDSHLVEVTIFCPHLALSIVYICQKKSISFFDEKRRDGD